MRTLEARTTLAVSTTALVALRPYVEAPEAKGSAVRVTLEGFG